jgi:hypothetical protein
MKQIPTENIDAGIDPGLILLRGTGSRDIVAAKRGVRNPTLKISALIPVGEPISFIQHAVSLNSLSLQVLYYKGSFASPTDVISLLYKGMRIDKLTVECSVEDPIKATVEMVGQDVQTGNSKISGATYYDFTGSAVFSDSYVQRGTAAGGSLTDVLRVTDWKFTIENNLKPVPVIRSSNAYLLKYLRERHRNLTGELTFEFEDKTEFDDVINDSEFSLKFGLSGGSYALFTYCKWQNVSIPTKIEDLISLKASFVAQGVSMS